MGFEACAGHGVPETPLLSSKALPAKGEPFEPFEAFKLLDWKYRLSGSDPDGFVGRIRNNIEKSK
jgi:hypothetical protein